MLGEMNNQEILLLLIEILTILRKKLPKSGWNGELHDVTIFLQAFRKSLDFQVTQTST